MSEPFDPNYVLPSQQPQPPAAPNPQRRSVADEEDDLLKEVLYGSTGAQQRSPSRQSPGYPGGSPNPQPQGNPGYAPNQQPQGNPGYAPNQQPLNPQRRVPDLQQSAQRQSPQQPQPARRGLAPQQVVSNAPASHRAAPPPPQTVKSVPSSYRTAPPPPQPYAGQAQQRKSVSGGILALLISLGVALLAGIGVVIFLLLNPARQNTDGANASGDSVLASGQPAVTWAVPDSSGTWQSAEVPASEASSVPVTTAATETTEAPTAPPTTEDPYAWLEQLNRRYGNYFDFTPDKNGFIIADSSTRRISRSELYNRTEHEVCMARNEIYARNGYLFDDSKYGDYYSCFSWYHGVTKSPELTELEKDNLKVIQEYEKDHGW